MLCSIVFKSVQFKYAYFQRRQSSKQHVVLKGVSLKSAGTYKVCMNLTQPSRRIHATSIITLQCEVSGEAPSFKTKFDSEDMVVVTPSKAEIVGAHPKYLVGDTVNVTCISTRLPDGDSQMLRLFAFGPLGLGAILKNETLGIFFGFF